ncbi:tumor necrosis factor receptor superfamily member 1A [Centropristis striata]|uniref:tumor necrosis factor receptor superfamily member 1A n=1 Tax=Centropristis striata TaxID=184440 RepID=UPI0027E06294|nr:tumor necrosis factor receptor superfamily member 1A [Centropristis striata]
MDFVLVFPLILAFLSTVVTQQKSNSSCHVKCPAGYRIDKKKIGDCADAKHRCERCGEATYTAQENTRTDCIRCTSCGNYEVELKPCTFNSNVVCDCKMNHYNKSSSFDGQLDCQPCSCERCGDLDIYPDYNRKCQPCQRCLEFPKCKKKCLKTYPTNLPTAATTSPSPSPSTATQSTVSNNTSDPVVVPLLPQWNTVPWMFLVVFIWCLVAFVCLLPLLICSRNWFRDPVSCPCWTENKDLEPPMELTIFNEQSSHQGGSPETQTINISEVSPMMTVSQTPEHPAPINPADDEHKASRQDEHWPAIILYAIIKEVPLRRWKEFLRLLSVADQQLERVELEAGLGLGSMERQYQMLRLWSQRSTASLDDVFSALHYMDLSGCAQLLQESLERLQGRPELTQGTTACSGITDHGYNGTMQDT